MFMGISSNPFAEQNHYTNAVFKYLVYPRQKNLPNSQIKIGGVIPIALQGALAHLVGYSSLLSLFFFLQPLQFYGI